MRDDRPRVLYNPLGQPVGEALTGWTPPQRPPRESIAGRLCRLEPVDPDRHAADLFEAFSLDASGAMWTWLPYGPFERFEDYVHWMREACLGDDPLFFAIVDAASGRATGVASYMRIDPRMGVIEVGHLGFSPRMQRSAIATEAMYLMMRRAFELGYRRYEWKCDSLNAPSRSAARRLGFAFEGLFRQAVVVKGRNRDTAWFSIIDREWPQLRQAFDAWLDPANFDEDGVQRRRLSVLTADAMRPLRGASGPDI